MVAFRFPFRGLELAFRGRTIRSAGVASCLLVMQMVGCNAVVDTDYLTAGKDGLVCAENQKVCPSAEEDGAGLFECTGLTNPQTGCARDKCSPCQLPGAVARCTASGACGVAVCSEKNLDCDGDESNGCEIDTATDMQNCGACGRVCAQPNAVTSCVRGVCEFVICAAPYEDCDDDPRNGCETNAELEPEKCGRCADDCIECEDGVCMD